MLRLIGGCLTVYGLSLLTSVVRHRLTVHGTGAAQVDPRYVCAEDASALATVALGGFLLLIGSLLLGLPW
jgi:hypothetical protein